MSTVPSEPEKYSIDEIMDRLKNSPDTHSDGELVTRADGSPSIRVRKRKRRTVQPHKEDNLRSQRSRVFQVTAVLVLIFLGTFIIGAAIIYANSSSFRSSLIQKIANASGAAVQMEQFRMNPKTANAQKITLQWPDGNILKSFDLGNIVAEISPSSFLGKSMNGEEVIVAVGSLALQIPKPDQAILVNDTDDTDLAIHFNRYRIPQLDITLGDTNAPLIKLSKSEGSLNPENVNGRPQLSLYRGLLIINGWPKLRLDHALVEFRGKDADIIGLRMLHETDDRSVIEFSGSVAPYQTDHLSTLAVRMDSFELSGITGPALGRLFSGRIDSLPTTKSNYFSFLPTAEPSPVLDIAFHTTPASRIAVQGFPCLFALAQLLDDQWFEHPVFESDVAGVFHRENGIVSLRDLNFESKGRIALRGEVSLVANQTLSGNLQVGLAEAMITASKNPRLNSLFGPVTDGFRWVTLKIGGPASTPTDNFKELFLAAVATPQAPAAPAEHEGSTFEELTRPK